MVETMAEVLTLEEIEARYPDEWVYLEDPETDRHHKVLRGRVVAHGKDRDEMDEVAITSRAKSKAIRYTGEIPFDVVFAL